MKSVSKLLISVALFGILSCPSIEAQSGFFFTVGATSENLIIPLAIGSVCSVSTVASNWDSDELLGMAAGFVLSTISNAITLSGLNYHSYSFYENGERVKLSDSYWKRLMGTKAENLFGNLQANLKFGWLGAYSPVGVYGRLGYHHRNLGLQLSHESTSSRYAIGTFCPGVGIRLAPGNLFDLGWTLNGEDDYTTYTINGRPVEGEFTIEPIIDFGTNYNKAVYYKGPYEKINSDGNRVLNDGLSYTIAAGISLGRRISFMLGTEWLAYDIFNRDFAVGDSHPFENLKSRQFSIFLNAEIGF